MGQDVKSRAPKLMPLEKRLMLDASLPAIAGQVLWLDAADAATIKDTDGDNAATGTGGANNGFSGKVATWVDKSTSGFNVTNGTATQQPTYTLGGLNGKNIITFDGTDDKLRNTSAVIGGDDYTIFIVFDRSISAGRDGVFEMGNGGSRNALFVNDSANKLGMYVNGTFYNSSAVYTAGTYEIVTMMQNTNAINMWRNNSNQVSTTASTRVSTTGIYVADDSSGGDELNGHIAEIIVYDRDLSSDERRDVENYLSAKWGMSVSGNTAPVLATNTGATVSQSDPVTITSAMLSSTDTDNSESILQYKLTDLADYGTLTNTNTGHTYVLGEYFTQADIDAGYIKYTHDGTANFSDSFSFTVSDMVATTAASTFNLTITPDNIAPSFQGWNLVSSENFEAGATGWSSNFTETGGTYLTRFLGRHSQEGGAQNTYKTYTMTGTQDYTVVTFDMYKIDSWDGEFFRVFVNDTQVINLSLINNTFSTPADATSGVVSYTVQEMTPFLANFAFGSWNEQIFRFTLTIQNSAATNLKIGFSSTLDQAITDEAWGVDNVNIYEVRPSGTPGPIGIIENSSIGTVVGQVSARDPDVGQSITYSIVGGTGASVFSINATTGVITTAAALNYESIASYTLDVRATDNGAPAYYDQKTITINVLDLPENTAPTVNALGPISIAENTANSTVIGTITGSDAEGNTLTWSITGGNTDNIFAINSSTGAIRVNSNTNLNYEWDNSYTLTIRAQDNGFGSLTASRNVTINITNVNEAPTFNIPQSFLNANPYLRYNATTGNFYLFVSTTANYATATSNAAANLLNGVAGHLATITSSAENTYVRALGSGNIWLAGSDSTVEGEWRWTAGGAEAGQMFWLGAAAGAAQGGYYTNWTASNPDNASNEDGLEMTSTGQWNDAQTTVAKAYVIEWEGATVMAALGNGPFTIAENPALNQSVGFIHARDADAGDTLTYSITGGTGSSYFAVNGSTGEITVTNPSAINYESATSYTLNMRVQDTAGLFSTQTVTINITDVNETPVLSPAGPFAITENTASGTVVTTMSATDPDGVAQTLTYSIQSGNAAGVFAIDSSTGVLTLASSPDYEAGASYSLVIRATDNGMGALYNEQMVVVNITDVNEAPVLAAAGPFNIAENTAANTVITTMSATDQDGNAITYSITGGNASGLFAINATTGALRFASSPNYEAGSSYSLTIRATDNGTGALYNEQTVVVNITDVNEAPVLGAQGPVSIAENIALNTVIADFDATDVDAAQTITYSITGGNTLGIFAINSANGQIRIANKDNLNYETGTSYTLTVRATDNGTGALFDSKTLTINVTNVNEAPEFDPIQRLLNADPGLKYNAATGNFYRYIPVGQNFANAQTAAAANLLNGVSGYLANIGSLAENNFVRGIISGTAYIGGSDAGVEGEWRWLGGSNAGDMFWLGTASGSVQNGLYTNWNSGEPNQSGNEDALELRTNGGWNDINAATVQGYVIEWDGASVLASITNGPYSAAENPVMNQSIGFAHAGDPDTGDALTYSITGGSGASYFAINSATGEITIADPSAINYELATSYTLDLRVQDTTGLFDTLSITVNITDINEAPVLAAQAPVNIAEDITAGTLVADMNATDVDTGQTITYSIVSGNNRGVFSINSSTGEIRIANTTNINYEETNLYNLVIRATDNGTGALFDQKTVTVNITDVNEGPSFDAVQRVLASDPTLRYNATSGNFYRFVSTASNYATAQANASSLTLFGQAGYVASSTSASENTFLQSMAGGAVIWLGGSDSTVEGQWLWNGGAEAGDMFWLGTSGGSAQNGYYSNWAGGEPNDSGGNEDGMQMRTDGRWNDISAGNSFAYIVEWDGAAVIAAIQNGPYSLGEHTAVGASIGDALAADPDAGDTIAYSITGGTGAGIFNINATTGEITLATGVNYEVQNSYTLDLRVQDSHGSFDTLSITISILDQNDVPGSLTLTGNHIVENSAVGTLIGTLSTFDEDPTDTHTYSLLTNPGGKFIILNGNEIYTNGAIDYETNQNFSIIIRTDDAHGGTLDRTFTINVDDVLDTFTPPPATGGPSGTDIYIPQEKEDDYRSVDLLRSSLGGEQGAFDAFYGDFRQIVRENVTFEIASLLGGLQNMGSSIESLIPINDRGPVNADIGPRRAGDSHSQAKYTNLREAITFLQQIADSRAAAEAEKDDTSKDVPVRDLPHSAIDRQFVDVMTYHKERAAKLREALLGTA